MRAAALVACSALVLAACSDEPGSPAHRGAKPSVASVAPTSRPPAVSLANTPVFGVHVNLGVERGSSLRRMASLARASGVTWLREDLPWAGMEPRPGVRRWRRFDRVVHVAAQRRLNVLPIIGTTPAWAGPEPGAPPPRPSSYARFAAAVAHRYGPGGTFWRSHPRLARHPIRFIEHYNEPWFRTEDPAAYARAVMAAHAAVHRTNRRVGSIIAVETSWVSDGEPRRGWLGKLYAAEPRLSRAFDGVSVHPYSRGSPLRYVPGEDYQARRLEQVRGELVARGDRNKPLWITEFGWSTCARRPPCVDEPTQARYLREFLHLVDTRWSRYVAAVFLFRLRDTSPLHGDDPEREFGILRGDARRKPGWAVWRRTAVGRTP
jgi:polysaccharide biosynthesis protein PslG